MHVVETILSILFVPFGITMYFVGSNNQFSKLRKQASDSAKAELDKIKNKI